MTQLWKIDQGMKDKVVEELNSKLKGSIVFTPASDGYEEIIKRWSTVAEKRAAIVVCVTSIGDISTVVMVSQAHSLDVAVCGGGHSPGGCSSTSGGLVIDLRLMNKVTVNPQNKTVVAQGGCLVKNVDEAAAEHGLVVPAGTVSHTGIGGLTLGGGYGWLTGQYGLTIDNLLEATMVLADGSVKKASRSENADLFWAIRGAGQCFGVAADLTFQGHALEPSAIWAGQLYFSARTKLRAVIEFANRFIEATDGKSAMCLVFHWPQFIHDMAVVAHIFHNGNEGGGKEIFGPLYELGPIRDTTTQRTYAEVNTLQDMGVKYGIRRTGKGACFIPPICPTFASYLIEELSQFYERVPDARNTAIILELYATEQTASVASTATAFANRGRHQNAQITSGWTDPANDEVCKRFVSHIAQKFGNELSRASKQRGNPAEMENITEYGNYDGLGSADARQIFGVNYRRLGLLKGQYDPDNVFKGAYPDLRKDLYLPWDPSDD